ncbi:MAG: geranylgeranylglyceryl/heptaprenylglyceryl phosphate synthase, partial [candidate division Zixibacteria bacterium]|nr:geranylgeranylglyceryl/heptaprenylglyceryl phosphate synthase [candidate division Zixibacteria bacterium]
MAGVYEQLLAARQSRGGGFLLLIDSDRTSESEYLPLAEAAADCGVDGILVGTSFMLAGHFGDAVKKIKSVTMLPVIIFPGSYTQVTPHADAILFTSLISGRNPQYLIDEQVKGAPFVKQAGLETIPTGYMLIESGPLTSVQFISGSLPIPRSKPDIAAAHAMAAQYLGMKQVYLEAGSGAEHPVPVEMVRTVASMIDIPVMVGGGLETPEDCALRIEAGAGFIVMGTRMERDAAYSYLRELTAASHPLEKVE